MQEKWEISQGNFWKLQKNCAKWNIFHESCTNCENKYFWTEFHTCYNLVTSLHKTGFSHILCGAEIDAQRFDYKGGLKQTGSIFVV